MGHVAVLQPVRWVVGILVMFAMASCAASSRGRPTATAEPLRTVERWDTFEAAFRGPVGGNPFVDVWIRTRFACGDAVVDAEGFYDGDGVYRVRCMPTVPGRWEYVTSSNVRELDGQRGAFAVTAATGQNHGPVGVRNTYHFAYADGVPFRELGTTCYSWAHAPAEMEEETLKTLAASPFNKVRFTALPREYVPGPPKDGGWYRPVRFPFVGTAPHSWDLSRFDVSYFQHLERRIRDLRKLGIEADVILFHPYDHDQMGFDRMPAEVDDRYVRYVVARFGAYRNVWWSMANEFDLMKQKKMSDWDRIFQVVQAADPYGHLRSIHQSMRMYDNAKPWVTHASLQNGSAVADFGRAILYRDVWEKPVVFDEANYEGDIPQRWGQLSGEQMTEAFWQATIAGTYAGHSEIFSPPRHQWLATGGTLEGTSPARLAFLKKVLETAPAQGIEPIDKWRDVRTAGKAGSYYLIYFGREAPKEWTFELPKTGLAEGMQFKVEVLDTWNMTATPVEGAFAIHAQGRYRFKAQGEKTVALPARPYMALRVTALPGDANAPGAKRAGVRDGD